MNDFAAPASHDPLCGMIATPDTPHRLMHKGEEILFCSAACKGMFEADPTKYAAKSRDNAHRAHNHGAQKAAAGTPKLAIAAGTKWTCPMHPQIVRDGPGACPICGMALEPMTPSADAGPNPELVDMSRRFWIRTALAAPMLALEMGRHLLGIDRIVPPAWNGWHQFALATPLVLWAGWPFFERGYKSLRTHNLNMFTLIALGTGVAWSYSVAALFAPALFPPAFRDAHGLVAVYFEAAAVITVLVLLGQVLELQARERTGGAIRALLDLAPKTAWRIGDGGEEEVPLARAGIAIGDVDRRQPDNGGSGGAEAWH